MIDNFSLEDIDFEKLNFDEAKIVLNFYKNLKSLVPELIQIGSFAYCTKELRKLKKITQKELSKEINVSENTIYNYENGKTEPNNKTRELVKKELCISDYFLEIFKKFENKYLKEKTEREKELYKDLKYYNTIVNNLKNRKEDKILKEIINKILEEKVLKFEEINNVINSYIMLSSNPAISLKKNDDYIVVLYNLDSEYNPFNILMELDDFIHDILLPISSYIENLFFIKEKSKINYFEQSIKSELDKQYIKLGNAIQDYLKQNQEGDNNE